MKIALVTNGIYPYVLGGMQKHSYYLAKYLAKEGFSVDIFHTLWGAMDKADNIALEEYYENAELDLLEFIKIPKPNQAKFPGHYIYDSYQYSKNVLLEIEQQTKEYDLIYFQGFSGWAYMAKYKGQHQKAITVSNFHGLEMFQKSASWKSKLEHLYFRPFVKRNIELADYSQSLGGKLNPILSKFIEESRIIEIGIGVDESWIEEKRVEVENTRKRFVFLGRYERRKGIEELSIVLENLMKKGRTLDFQIDFIGPIPKEKQLESPDIVYHGLVRDPEKIKDILRKADIFLCPSYSEGMPTVILEAMACSCAIIASNVGAVSEQVSKANGWLISAGDVAGLEKAILEGISLEEEKLLLLKQESRQLVTEKFLWRNVVKKMISEFKRIAS